MKGYFKNEGKTKETIDEEGWSHTGVIGEWKTNGSLKIIDRKKHIFKLAQGEYVAPERIENVYLTAGCVSQIFVTGDSLKSFLVGIVVPDFEGFSSWCEKNVVGISGDVEFSELCGNELVREKVLQELTRVGKVNKLNGFEQVKRIYLECDPFTAEKGMLTATLKSKRPQLAKFYEGKVEELYEN